MRSTAGSCMSPDWPACSWTGPTPRASSTNSVRFSTVACLPHRRSRRGRSKTAPRPTRRCWTVRPASSRCCCLPATGRREIRDDRRPRASSRHHASPTVHTVRKEAIMTTVGLSFAALTIDSADPAALADFWGNALGRPVSPGAVAGDTAIDTTGPDSGPRMILHSPPGPGTAKNSIHPVLVTDHHDEEIERLTRLGARRLNEIKVPPAALPPGVAAVRQTTFADPEGNEFDLVTWQPE